MIRFGSIVLLTMLALSGCCDKGTDPPPGKPADYIAYVSDLDNPLIFRIHTRSFETDSFVLPIEMSPFFFLDPKGQHMYGNVGGSGVVSIDLATMDTSLFWPSTSWLDFSPNDKLVTLFYPYLQIRRRDDMQLVCSLGTGLYQGCYSADSKHYYATASNGSSLGDVVTIRVDSGVIMNRKSIGQRDIAPLLVSADQRYWFFNDFSHSRDSIIVYDILADSTIFSYRLVPGFGDLVQTHNSRYLFFSNPGPYPAYGQPGEPYIHVYDVRTRRLLPPISAVGVYGTDTITSSPTIGDLDVTPDDKFLVATAMGVSGKYVIVSIPELQVVHYGQISRRFLYRLAIQSGVSR